MAAERRLLLALATVVALAGGVYLNSLGNRFALDDEGVIATNPQVHGVERIPEAVTGSYWPDAGARGLYRPLSLATYAVDWEIWDGHPFGFHLVNVLLHATVSALVLLLLLGLGAALPAAWAGAAVFAVHPVHVEAVANVVGRAELLAALFFLAAAIVYRKGRGGWRTAVPVALLYMLSLLSKESGITLPAVLVLLHWVEKRDLRQATREALRRWPVFVGMAAALGLYMALRVVNIGTFLGLETPPWFWGLPERARFLTAVRVWPEYLRLMLVPLDLVPDYGPGVIIPQLDPLAPLVVLGALLGGLAALVAWRARRTAPLLTAAIAWFPLTVLPVAGILFPVGVILAERTLYIPSVAVAIAVAAAARWLRAREGLMRPAAAVLTLVLVLGAVRTWTANPVWRDSLAVMNHLLDHHHTNFRAQWGVANHFAARGDTAAALAHMELATRMVPGQVRVRDRYGELLLAAGQPARAAAQFDTSLQVVPGSENARAYLALSLIRMERPDSAARAAARGLDFLPDSPVLHHMRARALARDGAYEAAARARQQALDAAARPGAVAPAPAWAQWTHLAALELLAGDPTAARDALRHAADAAPDPGAVPSMEQLETAVRLGQHAAVPLW